MLKPLKCLLFTQVALSAALSAYEEEELLDELFLDETSIADVSEYPCIAERSEAEPGAPSLERKHHYFLMGEMLYLKPSLDSMPWLSVYNNTNYSDPSVSSTKSSSQSDKLKAVNIPFDFGFRVAAGFNATWLNLQILASWERFHTSQTDSVPKLTVLNVGTFNQPTAYALYWGSGFSEPLGGQVYYANNKTQFHWDQIDLAAKIPLKALNRFVLSPVLGVRGLISNFNSTTSSFYNQYGNTYTTTPPFNESISALKQKYNAIGLLGGLDGDVNFGMGLHLSALLEGALVFGEVKTYNDGQLILPGPTVFGSTTQYPGFNNTSMKSYGFKPMLDAQVALSWNRAFLDNKITLNMHIGYEAHFMPNFYEFFYYITDSKDSPQTTAFDLTMQGLDAGIGLSF